MNNTRGARKERSRPCLRGVVAGSFFSLSVALWIYKIPSVSPVSPYRARVRAFVCVCVCMCVCVREYASMSSVRYVDFTATKMLSSSSPHELDEEEATPVLAM